MNDPLQILIKTPEKIQKDKKVGIVPVPPYKKIKETKYFLITKSGIVLQKIFSSFEKALKFAEENTANSNKHWHEFYTITSKTWIKTPIKKILWGFRPKYQFTDVLLEKKFKTEIKAIEYAQDKMSTPEHFWQESYTLEKIEFYVYKKKLLPGA